MIIFFKCSFNINFNIKEEVTIMKIPKCPYWLLGAGISCILLIALNFIFIISSHNEKIDTILQVIHWPLRFIVEKFELFNTAIWMQNIIWIIIIPLCYYFLIGSLLGLIIGKIKNRK